MFAQTIHARRLKLYYTDTARKRTAQRFDALAPWLEACLEASANWLWSENGPGLSRHKGLEGAELQLALCGKKMIRTLNRDYRGKDAVTDVLSFQLHEDFNELWGLEAGGLLNLGDLFICQERAFSQACEFALSFEEEVIHLFVHGLLHLCGYDHELGDEQELEMQELEGQILNQTSKYLDRGELDG